MYFIRNINKKVLISIRNFARLKTKSMNTKQHIRNALVSGLFFLIIYFRIFYTKQNTIFEFTSDITIVTVLLAFSEIILSTLIHWPLHIIYKTIHLIQAK